MKVNFKYIILTIILNFIVIINIYANEINNLRSQRYCEILLSPSFESLFTVQVYNTIGLNNCPNDLWKQITTSSIKKETQAKYVYLNGPRYWVIDGMHGQSKFVDNKPRVLGGIAMRQAATLKLSAFEIVTGSKPYHIHEVDRDTTYLYKSGQPIYELSNAKGEVYVMQTYSGQKVSQTESSLTSLDKRIKLPNGWHFNTRILKHDTELSTINHKAYVIQDDLLNTYQKETDEFIKLSK